MGRRFFDSIFLFQVSIMIFLRTINLGYLADSDHNIEFEKSNKGFVIQVGRKLLKVIQATIFFLCMAPAD